jgi:hypothetical protein
LGSELETNQAPNVNSLALGGTRLLAMAGGNGTVFINDPGANDWTISLLGNIALLPGEQAQTAAFTGSGWVVGIDKGVFRSVAGQEPWTLTNTGISGGLLWSAFAVRQQRLFVALDIVNIALIENSDDDGATWHFLDGLPDVFVFKMAFSGTDLYAGRADGLWRRPPACNSPSPGRNRSGISFASASSFPSRATSHSRCLMLPAGARPTPSRARGRPARTTCRGTRVTSARVCSRRALRRAAGTKSSGSFTSGDREDLGRRSICRERLQHTTGVVWRSSEVNDP